MPEENIKKPETLSKVEKTAKEEIKKFPEKELPPEQGGPLKLSKVEKKPEVKSGQERLGESGIVATTNVKKKAQQRKQDIDKILSEGLNDVYVKMPKSKQREFRETGEEIVKKIEKILKQTKVKVNKIIKLIIKWLSVIPNTNKYFLEQEAKIKADKIVGLRKDNRDYE